MMSNLSFFTVSILFFALLFSINALYTPSDDVFILDSSNFEAMLSSDQVWIVEFYAPWCGHCKQLAPEWKKAATALKGFVKVAALDADAHKNFAGRYGIQGFPTIKIFGVNKNNPKDYSGGRSAQGIIDAALSEVKSIVNSRIGGGGGKSSGGENDVIVLTDSNFDEEVLQSDDIWLIEFFAPWCGHCKRLEPEWAKAATGLKGKVKVGALDATTHTSVASRYGITGYPTIKYFKAGQHNKHSPENYEGGRTASDIIQFGNNKAQEALPPPEVLQIVDQSSMNDKCIGKSICVITFLAHILDTGAAGRNEHLDMLSKAANKFKSHGWEWRWSEGGAQYDLEQMFGVGGYGYPAMVVLNFKKRVFLTLRSAFDEEHINELLLGVSVGRGRTEPLRVDELPKMVTVEPWDGEDGVLPEEEHEEL